VVLEDYLAVSAAGFLVEGIFGEVFGPQVVAVYFATLEIYELVECIDWLVFGNGVLTWERRAINFAICVPIALGSSEESRSERSFDWRELQFCSQEK